MSPSVSLQRVCLAQIRAGNSTWVQKLRDDALAKIAQGGGMLAPLNSAGQNGKSFGREIRLDAVQVADIAQAALDEAEGLGSGGTGMTVPDFSA